MFLMKIHRLLEIVTILLNRNRITAKELASRFEVSTRTIYRDIDALSFAGVPVYTDKGRGGGISLLEGYTLNKALLTKSESEGLLLALKAMGATSYPEADVIIDKITSIFKTNQANEWIEFHFEGWSNKVNEQSKFSKIRDAIIHHQLIHFDYVNANGVKSSRYAEPVKLYFNTNTWYLIAYCLNRDSFRMFRLSRIKNMRVTDRHFTTRETGADAEQNLLTPLILLKLRTNQKTLSRLYDTFDEQYINENHDGSISLTALVPEEEWVYSYILSLGSDAEVIEPIHIREIIKRRAREIADKYE